MKRIALLHDLLQKEDLNALLIYNSVQEEPSYASWVIEKEPFDVCYVFVRKDQLPVVCVANWFVEQAKIEYPHCTIIPAATKENMVQYLPDVLVNGLQIWIAWNIPYKDYWLLLQNWVLCTDISLMLKKLYAIKSPEEINKLRILRNYTVDLLENITIFPGMTELSLADQIQSKVQKDGYQVKFLSIVWNELLKKTTVADPTDTVIAIWDALCIDFWIVHEWYHSDATRCYFVQNNSLEKSYLQIQELIKNSLQYITPWVSWKQFVTYIEKVSQQVGLSEYIFTDLGHGIGISLHEYPDLYHDDFIFEKWMVFTIEPEYRVWEYLLRYEDVYFIDDDGKAKLLR